MIKMTAILVGSLFLASALPATADDGRYQLEKSGDGYVRLDTQTGEMSICREKNSQLVCRLAADERAAFQDEIDRLDKLVDGMERRLAALESGRRSGRNELPSEEEFERTLGFMERFMRRFMDIIEDHDRPSGEKEADPDRT